ncbi:MAG TPA: hypothetical protein PKD16_18745 [Saprospiraceae bacterium]|jgi:hypothetical protein|nr:hypothetical protein [Saprospiraceae bacterium]HMT72212.1 hypothetical protein [Saprospiraceae bacterium]
MKRVTFATITHITTFKMVTYYSLKFENEEKSLFEKFVETYNHSERHEDFVNINRILGEMGNLSGAKPRYFRSENVAHALPTFEVSNPKGVLRLYCSVLSENVVILFNGGIKTTQKAQDCPNVSSHFRLAIEFSKKLITAIKAKDIVITEDIKNRLIINEDFEIVL